MHYKIEVQIEAVYEMQEAFEWYEKQRAGLGFEFLDEIDYCYDKLRKSPHNYTYVNRIY